MDCILLDFLCVGAVKLHTLIQWINLEAALCALKARQCFELLINAVSYQWRE